MSNDQTYYIGDKAITSGGKTHSINKVVTAKIMGLDDETFKAFVKKERIIAGKPPEDKKKKAARKAREKAEAARAAAAEAKTPVLRSARIDSAIKEMFNSDGSHKSVDDFTGEGKPKCEALDVVVLFEGEAEISAAERDEAWERYEADKAKATG